MSFKILHIERKAVVTLMLLSFITVGCSNNSEPAIQPSESAQASVVASKQADQPQVSPEPTQNGLTVTKDDVTISITDSKVSPVIGDRTKDNVYQDNGDYFAMGSDIVKAADYEQIEVKVGIDNKTSKAIHFSRAGWSAKMPDGYEIKVSDIEGKADQQMASNQTGEGKLTLIKEKTITGKKLLLTYKLMDYGDEFKEALQKAMRGELTKEEFEKQFHPQEMNFEISL